MENISIDEFEKELRNVFTRVADDQEPVSVMMDEGREVILVDGAEYRSVMETLQLFSHPVNPVNPVKVTRSGIIKSFHVSLHEQEGDTLRFNAQMTLTNRSKLFVREYVF